MRKFVGVGRRRRFRGRGASLDTYVNTFRLHRLEIILLDSIGIDCLVSHFFLKSLCADRGSQIFRMRKLLPKGEPGGSKHTR